MNVTTKNFFRQMREADAFIKSISPKNSIKENAYKIAIFNLLVTFIEEDFGNWSDVTKYICEHWRLSTGELRVKWNADSGKDKSIDSVRGQVIVVSNQLYQLFPFDLSVAFGYNGHPSDASLLERISVVTRTITTYGGEKFGIMAGNCLSTEVLSCVSDTTNKYDISDCEAELVALKTLTRSNIYGYLDNCDLDKLSYLVGVLNQPLLIKAKGERARSLNEAKMQILNELGLVEPIDISGFNYSASNENETVEMGIDSPSVDTVSVTSSTACVTDDATTVSTVYETMRDILINALIDQEQKDYVVDQDLRTQAARRCSEWYRLLDEGEMTKAVSFIPSDMARALKEKLIALSKK